MNIIKTKYAKRKKYKDIFTGFHISSPVLNFLRLYIVSNEITLSALVRGIIVKWINDHNLNENKLEKEITYCLQRKWTKLKASGKMVSFDMFLENSKKELIKKKIETEQAEKIIKAVNK